MLFFSANMELEDKFEGATMLDPAIPPVLSLSLKVLSALIESIGSKPAEAGGVLGGGNFYRATHFYFDKNSKNSTFSYEPNTEDINALLAAQWNPMRVHLVGLVHSHSPVFGNTYLSTQDKLYAKNIVKGLGRNELWFPVIYTIPDTGEFRLIPWIAGWNDGDFIIVQGRIKVISTKGFGKEEDARLEQVSLNTKLEELVIRRPEFLVKTV